MINYSYNFLCACIIDQLMKSIKSINLFVYLLFEIERIRSVFSFVLNSLYLFKFNSYENVLFFLVHYNRDNELTSNEGGQLSNSKCSGHSSNRCTNNINNNNGNNNNNVGGPLMTGGSPHLNGQSSIGNNVRGMAAARAPTSSSSSSSSNLNVFSGNESTSASCNPLTSMLSTSNSFNQFSGGMDLGYEIYPSSTWDLDADPSWGQQTERPESRISARSNSRPNSQPAPVSPSSQGNFTANSNVAAASHCSPMQAFSPSSAHNNGRSFSNPFPFSPLQDHQTGTPNTNGGVGGSLAKRLDEGKTEAKPDTQNCAVSTESGRLRDLLTKGGSAPSSDDNQDSANNSSSDNSNKHKILKGLLKEADDDDHNSNDNDKIRNTNNSMVKSNNDHSKSSGGNNMLLQVN